MLFVFYSFLFPFFAVFCKEIFYRNMYFFIKNVKINGLFFTFGVTYGGKYVV